MKKEAREKLAHCLRASSTLTYNRLTWKEFDFLSAAELNFLFLRFNMGVSSARLEATECSVESASCKESCVSCEQGRRQQTEYIEYELTG